MEKLRLTPYSFQKGSSTFVINGTTAPPSLLAVCCCGEWTVGQILDCYWHFGSVGDQYLGRILCGLTIDSDEFDKLPPHWIILNPMEVEDEDI